MVTITRKITTSCFSTVAAKKEKRHTCTKTVPLSYANLFMSFFDLTPQASQVNCTNKLLLGSFSYFLHHRVHSQIKRVYTNARKKRNKSTLHQVFSYKNQQLVARLVEFTQLNNIHTNSNPLIPFLHIPPPMHANNVD